MLQPTIRTENLVQLLLDYGFTPGVRGGGHTDFSHMGGAVITVPTGQEAVPPAFVSMLVEQFYAMGLASPNDLTRILLG
jgi:predicted RNA binding protein YcfA (HicA-like mRNA interferase family)